MSKTATQLADEVLYDMGVADRGETPDATDRTRCTDAYASVWEELNGHGQELIYWTQAEIPLPVFLMMRDLVRLEVQGAFGKPLALADRELLRDVILKRLRRHTQTQASGIPQRVTYY